MAIRARQEQRSAPRTRLIQGCNATTIDEAEEVRHCNEFLSEFYENMALAGKNDLVKQAGRVAAAEFAKATESPASRAQTHDGARSFAGNGWTPLGRLNRFCSRELLCGGGIPKCNSANQGKVVQDRRSHNDCVAQGCEGGTQTITDRHGTYPANFETYVCEHP